MLEALRAARPALRARCVPAAAAAGEQGEGGADVRGGAAGSEEQEEGSQCEGYSDSELGRGDSSSSSEEEDPEYAYKLWWREMYQASLEQYPDEGSDE